MKAEVLAYIKSLDHKKTILVVSLVLLLSLLLFKDIEVVAPGTGITTVRESNVMVKAPVSAYIVEVPVSEGQALAEQQPLLVYRNLQDEYQLSQVRDSLKNDVKLQQQHIEERCFLTGNTFNEVASENMYAYDCQDKAYAGGAGGQYILQFYRDYLQERLFHSKLTEQRRRKLDELYKKRESMNQKRNTLKLGQGETLRYFDLDISLSDVNSEIVQFQINESENEKKVADKLIAFEMRRAERVLTLDEQIERLEREIIDKKSQQELLLEKQRLSIIRSPVNGSVLKMTDGVSTGVFVDQGTQLFVLKKLGFSQEVDAKFDTRYRHFLALGKSVKIKINAPGYLKLFDGKIAEISSDAIEYEESARSDRRYYRVSITPEQAFVDLALSPGIDVEIYIVDKDITAMEYIMSVIPMSLKFDVW